MPGDPLSAESGDDPGSVPHTAVTEVVEDRFVVIARRDFWDDCEKYCRFLRARMLVRISNHFAVLSRASLQTLQLAVGKRIVHGEGILLRGSGRLRAICRDSTSLYLGPKISGRAKQLVRVGRDAGAFGINDEYGNRRYVRE